MTSLLNPTSSPKRADRPWTVGYCLLQDGLPPADAIKTDGDVKACDVTSSDSDEGIGSVTSSGLTDFDGKHSRKCVSGVWIIKIS